MPFSSPGLNASTPAMPHPPRKALGKPIRQTSSKWNCRPIGAEPVCKVRNSPARAACHSATQAVTGPVSASFGEQQAIELERHRNVVIALSATAVGIPAVFQVERIDRCDRLRILFIGVAQRTIDVTQTHRDHQSEELPVTVHQALINHSPNQSARRSFCWHEGRPDLIWHQSQHRGRTPPYSTLRWSFETAGPQ